MQPNINTAGLIQTTFERKLARFRGRMRSRSEPKNQGGYGKGIQCDQLSSADAAYIAGFVDGEGCICGYRRKAPTQRLLHLTVAINNTHRGVMDWIGEVTGLAYVSEHGGGSARHKKFFRWQVDSAAAASLLEQLLPFLKIKRKQALLLIRVHRRAVDDLSGALGREWQNDALRRFRMLNRKGPESANATVR